jgi:hypothetical protein
MWKSVAENCLEKRALFVFPVNKFPLHAHQVLKHGDLFTFSHDM